MWIWILILIAVIFAVLLFCSVNLSLSYERCEGSNETKIFIKYLFIKKEIKKKEKKDTENKTQKEKEDLPSLGIKYYYELYKKLKDDIFSILDYTIKKAVVFKTINTRIDFGCKDAASTGVLTGTLNGILYNIIAFFHNNFTLKDWKIEVNPDFENEKFCVWFDCIVKLKTVHIIIIAFKGLKIFLKLKKELKKGRKNNGTSNSRADGNSNE